MVPPGPGSGSQTLAVSLPDPGDMSTLLVGLLCALLECAWVTRLRNAMDPAWKCSGVLKNLPTPTSPPPQLPPGWDYEAQADDRRCWNKLSTPRVLEPQPPLSLPAPGGPGLWVTLGHTPAVPSQRSGVSRARGHWRRGHTQPLPVVARWVHTARGARGGPPTAGCGGSHRWESGLHVPHR